MVDSNNMSDKDIKDTRRSVLLNENDKIHFNTKNERSTPRRGFLGRLTTAVGATLATSLGLTRLAAASKAVRRRQAKNIAAKYTSEDKVRRAIQGHAKDILKELSESGFLETDSVSELPVTEIYASSFEDYFEADDGVIVLGTVVEGGPRAKIQIKRQLSERKTLYIVVVPQLEHSHAVVVSAESNELRSFSKQISADGDVSTQACTCQDYDKWCELDCIEGRCECLQFHDGNYCNDDYGDSCSDCYTDTSCVKDCDNTDKTCP